MLAHCSTQRHRHSVRRLKNSHLKYFLNSGHLWSLSNSDLSDFSGASKMLDQKMQNQGCRQLQDQNVLLKNANENAGS